MAAKNKAVINVNVSDLPADFSEIIQRAYKPKPDPKDVKALQILIDETPGLWRMIFDFSALIQKSTIEKIASDKVTQTCIRANINAMKQELGYVESAELERLLIENVISTWLYFQWADYQLKSFIGRDSVRFVEIEFWEKRLAISQSRYVRACEALARVRRLFAPRPSVQINLAAENSQQVNFAGDLQLEKK